MAKRRREMSLIKSTSFWPEEKLNAAFSWAAGIAATVIAAIAIHYLIVPTPRDRKIDLLDWCLQQGQGITGIKNIDGTAYGWRCVGPNGESSIDGDSACKLQNGQSFRAALDPKKGKDGWFCRSDPEK